MSTLSFKYAHLLCIFPFSCLAPALYDISHDFDASWSSVLFISLTISSVCLLCHFRGQLINLATHVGVHTAYKTIYHARVHAGAWGCQSDPCPRTMHGHSRSVAYYFLNVIQEMSRDGMEMCLNAKLHMDTMQSCNVFVNHWKGVISLRLATPRCVVTDS